MIITTLVAFALPAMAATIYFTMQPLWNGGNAAPRPVGAAYKAITLQTVVFVIALYALALLVLVDAPGIRPIAPRAAIVFAGLLLIGIGNLLPRTRPNLFLGIRTARTLEDRELWIKMHRAAGYISVGAGAAIACAAALFPARAIQAVGTVALIGAVAGLCGCYWIYSAPSEMTVDQQRARRVEAAFWVLRISLALLFIYVGMIKVPGGPRRMWVRLFAQIGFGQWFRFFTALVEMAGGMLLMVHAGIPFGVALLVCSMIGALFVHVLVVGIGFQTVIALLLLTALLVVGWRHHVQAAR